MSPARRRPSRVPGVVRRALAEARRAANHVGTGRREAAVMIGAFAAYNGVRALGRTNIAEGLRNAERLERIQARLGIDIETKVQRFFLRHRLGMPAWNALYLGSQLVVMPSTLFLVHRYRRDSWPFVRNLALISWTAGLVWYAAQPTAPPRLRSAEVVDTVSSHTVLKLDSRLIRSLYNPVAAMPSLHVGMSAVAAWALVRLTPWTWSRALGYAYPALVTVAVVVTGNHYVLDVAGGLAVVLPSAAVAALLSPPGADPAPG